MRFSGEDNTTDWNDTIITIVASNIEAGFDARIYLKTIDFDILEPSQH